VLAQVHVLKSQDNGATWVEVDENNGPEVSLEKSTVVFHGLASPIWACYKDANTILIAYFVWDYTDNTPAELRFCTFDMASDTFGAETPGGPTSTKALNMSIAYRSGDDAIIFEYDGSETVGSPRSRVFYVINTAGVWGAEAPIDVAQTGANANYNVAGAVTGDGGRTHLFYRVFATPFGAGDMSLQQRTLTSVDVLVAAVIITTQVDSSTNLVNPFPQPWSQAVGRFISAAIHLYIAYVKDTDKSLYFQSAVSVDTPVFSEQLIGGTTVLSAGIFKAGNLLPGSRGLIGATQDTFNAPEATGSVDETTWDAMTALVVPTDPDTSLLTLGNFAGNGINSGAGGFLSAGIVLNSVEIPPG